MTKDPMDIAFEKAGGIASFVKWIKDSNRNRGDFYSWWAKRFNQPLVQNNVNVNNIVNEETLRRKLETEMMRVIDARKSGLETGTVVHGDDVYVLIPVQAAHHNEMMSPAVTE
jgi:hypothetical protein